MTLRLTIDRQRWSAHVDRVRTSTPGVVPVVKGNGYGFGRATLAAHAAAWSDVVVVGTVHEAVTLRRTGDEQVVALTPAAAPIDLPHWVIPTVGHRAHADAVAAHRGPVAVKLRSSMGRYGVTPDELPDLLALLAGRAQAVHATVLHLPLAHASPASARLGEVAAWLAHVPPELTMSLSHLEPADLAALRAEHPQRRFELRLGTALWHGDKSFLHLAADVVDVHPVRGGTRVGYRATEVPTDGWLVMVGAGSSHGVAPLDDGRSPFHLRRSRLAMIEPPHMHTTMCWLPAADEAPAIGEWVDVQRPLISVAADEVVWT